MFWKSFPKHFQTGMPLIHLAGTQTFWFWCLTALIAEYPKTCTWFEGLFLETRLLCRNKQSISQGFEPKISSTVLLEPFGVGHVWQHLCISKPIDDCGPLQGNLLPGGAVLQTHFNKAEKKSLVNCGNVFAGGRVVLWWCHITHSFHSG